MDYHLTTPTLIVLIVLAVWELIWKGMALWRARERSDLFWFVILLVINSVGILPIVYLYLTKEDRDAET